MTRKTYRVSPTFWTDHVARDLATSDLVKTTGRYCTYVTLNTEQYNELLSDAEHYADPDSGLHEEVPHLCQAAARVVKVLKAEGPPASAEPDMGESAGHAEWKHTRFGWCQFGPDVAHGACHIEFTTLHGQHHRCSCECHGAGDGTDT